MKLTFTFTSESELSSFSKNYIYKSYFEIPDEALELSDCNEQILIMVQMIGQLTYASLYVDCAELGWKKLLITASDTSSRKSRFFPSRATYLNFNNLAASQRRNRPRRLRILDAISPRDDYHDDIVKSLIEATLSILNADGNNWHIGAMDFYVTDRIVVNTFNRRAKIARKAQKKAEHEAKKQAAAEAKGKISRKGQIYFIQQGEVGPIKIGYSTNPEKRLQTLNTASPYPLKILHTIEGGKNLEKELHGRFADTQLDGEWFETSQDLLEYIESLKDE